MEEIQEVQPQEKNIIKYSIIGFVIILAITLYFVIWHNNTKPQKSSIDERMKLVEQMRDEKKLYERKITDLNQKIIKQKCDIFKDVKASTQWETDCKETFEQQQQITE